MLEMEAVVSQASGVGLKSYVAQRDEAEAQDASARRGRGMRVP